MSLKDFFRKPSERKQGLKILIYGLDGCGKSLISLGFPKIGYIDSEAKGFVYESNPKYNKNLEFVMDSNNYSKTTEAIKEILSDEDCYGIKTLVIDSETNMYETMTVSMMEVEEARARKKAKENKTDVEFAVNDANVSQRAYGKIKNKHNSLKAFKLQLSARGVNVISIAHTKDLMDKNQNKIGEIPDLRKGSTHDYDIIIRCYKEKDIITKKYKFIAYIEKDTTEVLPVGKEIDFTWENNEINNKIYELLEPYMNKNGLIINDYETVENLVSQETKADEEFNGIALSEKEEEFKNIFQELDDDKKQKAKEILKEVSGSVKIKEIKDIKVFEEIINRMKEL